MAALTRPLPDQSGAPEHPHRRATAMPLEQRRAAIIEATLPLLRTHGSAVTTRQIAEAAHIGEGTIFRAFPDKESLIEAALIEAFDPTPLDRDLAAVDRDRPLPDRLVEAARLFQERSTSLWELFSSIGATKPPVPRDVVVEAARSNIAAIVDLIGADADQLRCSADQAAQRLRAVVIAMSHPTMVFTETSGPEEIVSLLLDGIRAGNGPDLSAPRRGPDPSAPRRATDPSAPRRATDS
jgi:AcrR family transcriptional regulator